MNISTVVYITTAIYFIALFSYLLIINYTPTRETPLPKWAILNDPTADAELQTYFNERPSEVFSNIFDANLFAHGFKY
jgi:hypothetical protein